MVLRVVVSAVYFSGFPEDMKLALANAISGPVKTHVDGTRFPLFCGPIEDAFGGRVVCGNRGGGLVVAHFNGSGAKFGAFLAVIEESTHFGFHGGGEDVAHDATFDMNRSIDCGHIGGGLDVFRPKKEISTVAAAGARFGHVGCIAVDMQDHVGRGE